MSNWITDCESILTQFKTDNSIPYDFERFECDPNQPLAKQLPDSFITYFLVDDVGKTWSDGKETAHEPQIQVSFYYRDKSKILTIPDKIEAAFMVANFMRGNSGTIPYQKNTGHYGKRFNFRKYEKR